MKMVHISTLLKAFVSVVLFLVIEISLTVSFVKMYTHCTHACMPGTHRACNKTLKTKQNNMLAELLSVSSALLR